MIVFILSFIVSVIGFAYLKIKSIKKVPNELDQIDQLVKDNKNIISTILIEDKIRELLNNTESNGPIHHNYLELSHEFEKFLTVKFPNEFSLSRSMSDKFYEMCHEYDGRFGTTTEDECVKIIMDYKQEIGL